MTRSAGSRWCDILRAEEGSGQVIAMRDSKRPDGPVLIFTPAGWQAFTLGVQDGEFDLT